MPDAEQGAFARKAGKFVPAKAGIRFWARPEFGLDAD